ncbi:hypothetical protein pipiens_019978, partial [Culex pipiens pipiens]
FCRVCRGNLLRLVLAVPKLVPEENLRRRPPRQFRVTGSKTLLEADNLSSLTID